jgi:FKBP-type peptidyl-prolyl cis-trans isomerase FkpA
VSGPLRGTLGRMSALLRPHRLVLVALLLASAACDFGKVSSPTAPDQSGIPYAQTDLTIGTGTEATVGSTATVQYGAWLYSDTTPDHKGTQIDQNQFSFVVGANPLQVIKGFDQAVTGMKVGGTRRVIVPPALAYGSTGNGTIPPNAALVFDLALTAVVVPAS